MVRNSSSFGRDLFLLTFPFIKLPMTNVRLYMTAKLIIINHWKKKLCRGIKKTFSVSKSDSKQDRIVHAINLINLMSMIVSSYLKEFANNTQEKDIEIQEKIFKPNSEYHLILNTLHILSHSVSTASW